MLRTRTVHVATFGGVSAFPIRVAQQLGMFAEHRLRVVLEVAASSDGLLKRLIDGSHQIVHAAPDNFVAWSDRVDTPIVAWVGGSNGPISLVAGSAASLPELRHTRIGVDSPTSGFAPILRRLLRRGGIDESEVEFVALGATRLRRIALAEGRVDATMLTMPWSVLAIAADCREVADHRSVAPQLQTSCGGSLLGWLEREAETADEYLAGLLSAVRWLRDPGNATQASAMLATDLDVPDAIARSVLSNMTDGACGWPPTCEVDVAGIRAVCELRAEVLTPPRLPAEAYVNLDPYRRVMDRMT